MEVRRNVFANLEPAVLQQLQDMLHETNAYIVGLCSAMELLPPKPNDIKIGLQRQAIASQRARAEVQSAPVRRGRAAAAQGASRKA